MPEVVPCEHCGGDTEFTTQIAPLGDQPTESSVVWLATDTRGWVGARPRTKTVDGVSRGLAMRWVA